MGDAYPKKKLTRTEWLELHEKIQDPDRTLTVDDLCKAAPCEGGVTSQRYYKRFPKKPKAESLPEAA